MLSSAGKSWCKRFVWEMAFLRVFVNEVTQINDRTCVLPGPYNLLVWRVDITHFPSQKRGRSQAGAGGLHHPSHRPRPGLMFPQQAKSFLVNQKRDILGPGDAQPVAGSGGAHL